MNQIRNIILLWSGLCILSACTTGRIEFESDHIRISIDDQGAIVALSGEKKYLSNEHAAPLLTIKSENEMQLPDSILHQQWNTLDLMWDTTVMELALYKYNESGKLIEYTTLSYYLFHV